MIRASTKLRHRYVRPRVMLLLAVLAAMLVTVGNGWSKFGVSKTRAVYVMYIPPAFHAPGRELLLRFTSQGLGRDAGLAGRIGQQVEQALLQEKFRLGPSAPVALQGSIVEALASVDRERRPVNLNVRTGERIEKDKKGKEKRVEECKNQQVNAVYLTSRGRLVLALTVADVATRSTTFSRTIERSYLVESMVAGPRLCGNRTYTVSSDHLRYRGEILALLADQAAAEAIRLASGYSEEREALLAVDNELRAGNSTALAGNWPQALTQWRNADIPAGDNEKAAARVHNIGVAHEVMAAQAMRENRLDDADPLLNDAGKSYAQAISLDSGEKYFRDPMDRVQQAREVLATMLRYRELEPSPTDDLVPVAEEVAAPSQEASPDGIPENEKGPVRDYRLYVRTRLEARLSEPDAAFKKLLMSAAADYQVAEGVAAHVIETETRRMRILVQAMEKYAEDYKAVAADGAITTTEREMLQKRRQTLHLPEAQARAVEARFPLR